MICNKSQALSYVTYLNPKKSKTHKPSELSKTERNRLAKAYAPAGKKTAVERIFGIEMTFEKGRQTRNPNRSNAR